MANNQTQIQKSQQQKKCIYDSFFSLDEDWKHKTILLARHINYLDKGDGCYASNSYFAKKLKVSVPTIERYIRRLKKAGIITSLNRDRRHRLLGGFWRNHPAPIDPPASQISSIKIHNLKPSRKTVSACTCRISKKNNNRSLNRSPKKKKEERGYKIVPPLPPEGEGAAKAAPSSGDLNLFSLHKLPKRSSKYQFLPLACDLIRNAHVAGEDNRLKLFHSSLWFNPITPTVARSGDKAKAFSLWLFLTKNATDHNEVENIQKGWEAYVKHQNFYGYYVKRLQYFLSPKKAYWTMNWKTPKPLPKTFEYEPRNWVTPLFKCGFIDAETAEAHSWRTKWQFASYAFRQACQNSLNAGFSWFSLTLLDTSSGMRMRKTFFGNESDKAKYKERFDREEERLLQYKDKWIEELSNSNPDYVINNLRHGSLRQHIENCTDFYRQVYRLCLNYGDENDTPQPHSSDEKPAGICVRSKYYGDKKNCFAVERFADVLARCF